MRSLKEIWKFAFSPKVIIPPSPDELAMRFAAALIHAGKHENPDAAIHAAWWAVPSFYLGRLEYERRIGPMYFAMVNSTEAGWPGEDHDDGSEYTVRAGHDVEPKDFEHMADLHAGC